MMGNLQQREVVEMEKLTNCLTDSQKKTTQSESFDFEERKRNNKIRTLIDAANIPVRYEKKGFKNYDEDFCEKKGHIETVKEFVTNGEGTGLILLGSNGTGKTHIAIAALKMWISHHLKSVLFTESVKIVRNIKSSWDTKTKTEAEVIAKYTNPSLLIVDEIGVQFGSDTERLYLTEILNDRYNGMKPTIIIGNVDMSELKTIVGDRIIDRFREGGKVIVFAGESYRARTE